MTTRKRNEFLDIVDSDEEEGQGSEAGYDSEAAEESKVRSVKRRRTRTGHNAGSDSGSNDDSTDGESRTAKTKSKRAKSTTTAEDEDDDEDLDGGVGLSGEIDEQDDEDDHYLDATAHKSTTSSSTKKGAIKPPKKNKTGVVYLSSLPPYLKPFALKSLLETRGFSPITKVFLQPEVRGASAPRRRSNKRKIYTDGWVEFASKKTAKICAETLNASIVGGRKGSWYHDDVWNMKYLRGFKWADLMEQVQRERSEREARQKIEDARARKEDQVFVEGVEQGKVISGIQRKNEEKEKRGRKEGAGLGGEKKARKGDGEIRRVFRQNEVKLGRDKVPSERAALGDDAKKVLAKIF